MRGEYLDITHPSTKRPVRLYRLLALKTFDAIHIADSDGNKQVVTVKEGDIGGWVQSDVNLSHDDNSWVFPTAYLFGDAILVNSSLRTDARVYDNAIVKDSVIHGKSWIGGTTTVENCEVRDNVTILGHARLRGSVCRGGARVWGHAEIVDSTLSDGVVVCDNARLTNCVVKDTVTVKGNAECINCHYAEGTKVLGGRRVNETLAEVVELNIEQQVIGQ